MKKILFICLVSLWATKKTNAQMRDTTVNINSYKVDAASLLLKAKKQKTAAWILLGAGTGMAIAGLSIISQDAGEDLAAGLTTIFTLGLVTPEKPKPSAAGPILAIAGTGAMLGSIPFFIASGRNKNQAQLMLKNESVFFNPGLNIKEHLLCLGVKINL